MVEARTRDLELLHLLDADTPPWVVTPTRRLARDLVLRVARLRAEAGRRVSATPPIRALDDWMRVLGEEVLLRRAASGAGRVLLSPFAEQAIWEQVILAERGEQMRQELGAATSAEARERLGGILDASSLAATAADAWKRLCLWGQPAWATSQAEDVLAFRRWADRFRARLAEQALVTAAELPALVADAVARGHFEAVRPPSLLLLGFEKFDPALQRFREAWAERGVHAVEAIGGDAPPPAPVSVWKAPNPAVELRTVAARVRERLLQDPSLRIGVLCPDVAASAGRLERVLEEELDPAGVLDCSGSSARRFDFSEAPALGDYPLVSGALLLLQLGREHNEFDLVSRVLLSQWPRRADAGGNTAPYRAGSPDAARTAAGADRGAQGEGSGSERAADNSAPVRDVESEESGEQDRVRRALLETQLRRNHAGRLRLAGGEGSLAHYARKGGLPGLARRLEELDAHLAASVPGGPGDSRRDAMRSPAAWRAEWSKRLRILGWPGVLHEGAEGIVFQRWRDALDDLAELEIAEPRMRESHALGRLGSICGSTRVQPPAQATGVQVMGLLDAAGLQFDVVFVVGLVSDAFPPPPRPNPLLPVAWQAEQQGMPRASVRGEAELAKTVWDRVRRCAPEVHASWAAVGDRDEDTTRSALLEGLPAEEPEDIRLGDPWWTATAFGPEGLPLEAFANDQPGKPTVRSGGSDLLGHVSDCPFRAFVTQRLGARPLEEIRPQPDAAARGNLVHAALDAAYRKIADSSVLAGMSDAAIEAEARRTVRIAIESKGRVFGDADDLREAAGLWLEQVVAAWLRYERDARRDIPWKVQSLEQDRTMTFPAGEAEAIEVRFRADRIDQLPDGSLLLLDFKTSSTAKGKSLWNGERPKEPQLPLYASLLEEQGFRVEGLAFANLSARDDCSFAGIASAVHAPGLNIPGKTKVRTRDNFDEAREGMRASVRALADSYLRGDVRVDPRDDTVCDRCGALALCRKLESGAFGGDEAEDGDEE